MRLQFACAVALTAAAVVGCGGDGDDASLDGGGTDADAGLVSDAAAQTSDATPAPDAWLIGVPEVARFGDYVRYLLPGLGGLESAALDINDGGQIVGLAQTATGGFRACLWSSDGVTDLTDDLGEYTVTSYAGSINEMGQVLISAQRDTAPYSGVFVWSGATTAATALGFADSMNESGAVLGRVPVVFDDGYHQHAGLWSNGVLEDLGSFGAMHTVPLRVSEDGRAFVSTSAVTRRFFQVAAGVVTELVGTDGMPPEGVVVNGLGQAVLRTTAGEFFLWEGGVTSPLVGIPATLGLAIGFTASGWLGLGVQADDGSTEIYLRSPGGAITALENPGGWIIAPLKLDEAGNVVGRICGNCEALGGWPGLWRAGDAGLATSLGPIGGAEAMNVAGDIVGWVPIDIDRWMSRAAVWRYEPE